MKIEGKLPSLYSFQRKIFNLLCKTEAIPQFEEKKPSIIHKNIFEIIIAGNTRVFLIENRPTNGP